jgi:hypothetical protein
MSSDFRGISSPGKVRRVPVFHGSHDNGSAPVRQAVGFADLGLSVDQER